MEEAEVGDTTEAGLVAVARVARDSAYLCGDEVIAYQQDAQTMAWMIVAHVADMPQLAKLARRLSRVCYCWHTFRTIRGNPW